MSVDCLFNVIIKVRVNSLKCLINVKVTSVDQHTSNKIGANGLVPNFASQNCQIQYMLQL